jgi:hypothetical protein
LKDSSRGSVETEGSGKIRRRRSRQPARSSTPLPSCSSSAAWDGTHDLRDGVLIHGGWENDFISAGAGDDDIFGDAGNDYLRGDDGADWFHFTVGNGNDKVIDFRPLEGDEWFLYGIDEGAVRYKEYNFFGVSGTYVYLDGQKDTINFVGVNQAALDDTLEFRDIAGYDWSGVTLI